MPAGKSQREASCLIVAVAPGALVRVKGITPHERHRPHLMTRMSRIRDVAARAQVSTATVSRYFNDPDRVAKDTAKRIEEAVGKLDYIPNLVAGGLATNKSRVASVFVPVIANSLFNATIESMVRELTSAGMTTMLGITGSDHPREVIDAAFARRSDAIILTGMTTDEAIRNRLREQQRAIVIETWDLPSDPIKYAVGFSHRDVGKETAAFINERGYRRPHLVVADGSRARSRRDGFVEHWAELGQMVPTETTISMFSRFGAARSVFRSVSEIVPRPDVVICGSDYVAHGMLQEARHAGLGVPDDLAIFGFGNLSVAGETRPTISTVDIDGARIGRRAVEIIKQDAEGKRIDGRIVDVGFRIIARESA